MIKELFLRIYSTITRLSETLESIVWLSLAVFLFSVGIDLNDVLLLLEATLLLSIFLFFSFVYKIPPFHWVLFPTKRYKEIAPEDSVLLSIYNFRKRARNLRNMAVIILILQVASIVSGLAVFIFAEQITNFRYTQRNYLISYTKENLENVSRDMDYLKRLTERAINKDENFLQSAYYQQLTDYVESQQRFLASLKDAREALIGDAEIINSQKDRDPYMALYARFGSLVILFLAVQVFGRLYRFNLSLSSDYDAIADALLLQNSDMASGEKIKNTKFYVEILRPKNIDLPDVKSPFEYLFGKKISAQEGRGDTSGNLKTTKRPSVRASRKPSSTVNRQNENV